MSTLRLLKKGLRFTIMAVVLDDGACPAEEFLERLKIKDSTSHKSLVNLLARHADFGEIRNKQKSRVIEGRENLVEFKTKQGDRLVYFYLPGARTVLTHGFHKGVPASNEYDRAEAMRDQFINQSKGI